MRGRWVLGAVFVAAACSAERSVEQGPPAIQVHGCRELVGVPATCVLRDGRLRVWVALPSGLDVALRDGGAMARVVEGPTAVDGGQRWIVDVSDGPLSVHARGHAPAVVMTATSAPGEALAEVVRRRRAGRLDDADALLDQQGARPGVMSQRARQALARGDAERSARLFEIAIAELRTAERWQSLTADLIALAHVSATLLRRPDRAAKALAEIPDLSSVYADPALEAAFARVNLAFELRDVRGALAQARIVETGARRLGVDDLELDLLQTTIAIEAFAARWARVDAIAERLRQALARATEPCKRAELATNVGWHLLLRQIRAPRSPPDWPRRELELASRLYASDCRDDISRHNADINRAWLALLSEPHPEAKARVAALRSQATSDVPRTDVALLQLEGALALAERDWPAVERIFSGLETRGHEALRREQVLEGLYGQARALEARRRGKQALDRHRRIDAHLDELLTDVPWGAGRTSFLIDTTSLTEDYLRALLAVGSSAELVAVVRRSLARAHGDLDPAIRWSDARARGGPAWEQAAGEVAGAREELDRLVEDAWRVLPKHRAAHQERETRARERLHVAADALLTLARPPGPTRPQPLEGTPDRPVVLVHSLGPEWLLVLLAGAGDGPITRRLARHSATRDIDRAVDALLAPLGSIEELRWAVHPVADDLDWHARGTRRPPAVYILDAPAVPSSTRTSALVLADPTNALPSAKSEARAVEQLLVGGGWSVQSPAQLGRADLREAFQSDLGLFHYSGHGALAGGDGLDEELLLGPDTTLTTTEVLALRRVPREIVLGACTLGRRRSDDTPGGLSMAHAFLLRGAEVVIAAPRDVPDATTRVVIESLYRARTSGETWSKALRTAAEDARRRGLPDPDVFRLFRRT